MSRDPKSFRCEMQDVRAALMCSGGTREWFRAHDLSWQTFVAEGLPANALADTGDPMAMRVVAAAEKRNFPDG